MINAIHWCNVMLCYVMSSHKFVSVCVIQLINKLWFEIKVHFNDLMFVLKGIDLIESMLMKLPPSKTFTHSFWYKSLDADVVIVIKHLEIEI